MEESWMTLITTYFITDNLIKQKSISCYFLYYTAQEVHQHCAERLRTNEPITNNTNGLITKWTVLFLLLWAFSCLLG